MQIQSFALGLRTVSGFLPYAKKLADDEIKFLWLLIPQQVKDDVSDEVWAYACNQRLLDPNPDKEQALHLQLLKYVYRVRDGQPAFDWGFKEDLPQRMKAGAVFQGQQAAQPALLPVDDGPTNHLLQGLL
jgi:hypothetical protein